MIKRYLGIDSNKNWWWTKYKSRRLHLYTKIDDIIFIVPLLFRIDDFYKKPDF